MMHSRLRGKQHSYQSTWLSWLNSLSDSFTSNVKDCNAVFYPLHYMYQTYLGKVKLSRYISKEMKIDNSRILLACVYRKKFNYITSDENPQRSSGTSDLSLTVYIYTSISLYRGLNLQTGCMRRQSTLYFIFPDTKKSISLLFLILFCVKLIIS